MLICDQWFHSVFHSNHQAEKEIIFPLELHISLSCVYVCVWIIFAYPCVWSHMWLCVCVCVCVCADTCTWHIWGCLMNICVVMWSKNSWKSKDGRGFGWINFLLCIVMILAMGQIYHHHYIMEKMNFWFKM